MKFANKLKETTSATSTLSITLTGAVQYFRSLAKSIALGKLAVGDTNICFMVDDGAGNWEEGLYTITSATVITRTAILDSSNDGAAVTFAAGSKTVSNMIPAEMMSKVLSTDDAITAAALVALGSVSGTTKLLALDSSGGIVTAAVSLLPSGSASAPVDSTAPTTPGSLSSSGIGQTVATLNYTASTDNVGVSYYEVSRDGTTWTNNGTALSYQFTSLVAGTTYTFQVRAVDAAGNKSAAASLPVTTAAASGDSTAPTMAGSITTSSVTATGFTMAYSAGSDNVAVTRYEVSTDGGASWINNGTNLSYTKSDAVASTPYNLRVRCYDAAGNVSNVLSASVTTSAAGVAQSTTYSVVVYSGTTLKTSYDAASAPVSGGKKYVAPNLLFTGAGQYLTIKKIADNTDPATMPKAGWSNSNTVPPTVLSVQNTAASGAGNDINAATPMTKPGAYALESLLWLAAGANGNYYLWVQMPDGSWVCVNPSSPIAITGA